jgi:Cd2+/Zn2+-exporting ATPase
LISRDVELAITILVLGCPGALVIGVPVSNVAGIGNGARHGVLLKGSEVISDFSRVDTIVFDKTGTLTIGNPKVAEKELYTDNADDISQVMIYLASVENESDHPLAKAVVEHIGETEFYEVEKTDVVKGGGVVALVRGKGSPLAMRPDGARRRPVEPTNFGRHRQVREERQLAGLSCHRR